MGNIPAYIPEDNQPGIPTIEDDSPPALSTDVAADRAKKADFGLSGKITESYQDLLKGLQEGKESVLRNSAAAQIAYKNAMVKSQAATKMASAIEGPLNEEDLNMIDRRFAEPDLPASIFEDHFAKRYMDHMNWQSHNPDSSSWLKTATDNYPDVIQAYQKAGQNIISSNELINNALQETQQNIQDESWTRYLANLAKGFIPGYTNARLGMLFPGHGLQQEAINYHSMGHQEQVDYINRLKETYKDNPELLSEYLSALLGIGTQERFARDMMLPVDIATAGTGLGVGKKALFPATAVKDTVSGMVSSVGKEAAHIAAPAAAGDLETAGIRRATDNVMSTLSGNDPRLKLIHNIWDFFTKSLNEFRQNPGNFSVEMSNQIEEQVLQNVDTLDAYLNNRMQGERMPFMRAFQSIMKDAFEHVKRLNPSLDNKILNIGFPEKDQLGNYHVPIYIGNQYGKYFEAEGDAHFFAGLIHTLKDYKVIGKPITLADRTARMEKLSDITIERPIGKGDKNMFGPQEQVAPRSILPAEDTGSGYAIKIYMPWNETDKFTRNQVAKAIETNSYDSQTPNALVNYFLGGLRTPEETMSRYANIQRGIATHGTNVLNKIAIQWGKDIGELTKGTFPFSKNKQRFNEWLQVIDSARSIPDPDRPGAAPGYTFKNPGELEFQYRKLLGRSPDETEVKAYFAWKQLNELDWTLRELSVLRNKRRAGAMRHEILVKDAEGNTVLSPAFDAINLDKIPATKDVKVLVMGKELGQETVVGTEALREGTELGTILRTGRSKSGRLTSKPTVVQLYDDVSRPLEGWGNVKNEPIRYVVGNFNKRNINFGENLPRTGGGHFIYEYPFYLKQAIMTADGDRMRYEGDRTLWAIRTRAEGKIIEQRLNAYRELVRDGKYAEAKQYLLDNPVGYNHDEIFEKFKPTPKINSRTGKPMPAKPLIDSNEPIRLMDNNRSIGEAFQNEFKQRYGNKFVNGLRSGNPASMYNVAFTGERDVRELETILDQGSKGSPVWNHEPAKMVNPMTSLNRGLTGIINSFYFDDVKYSFMEHWLQEAAPYLDLRKGDLQRQGFAIFHSPKWIKGNAEQMERIEQLKVARSQHIQLVSRPSEKESMLMSIAQHAADAMYNKLGPKFVIDPLSMYSMALNGPAFLRGMAFHAKLGMFNPSQLLKQLNTWAVIHGIEGPTRATQASAAAYMYHLTGFNRNPEILDSMSKLVEKFGWKPGEYHEYVDLLNNTGFGAVGGEYAARDNIWSGNIIKSGGRSFLSLGDSFFTEGERNIRYGAMAAAYRRFRDANPTGALSDANKEEILQRARLLNVNMDRAANSIWQHGLSSIPFQFQTYALRTAELMFGKRLTVPERARLIGVYSILYGLPVAGTLSGFPIADWFRKKAMDNGYNVGEGYITTTLMEGVPSMLGEMITGHNYNIGEQYGGQGLSSLNNILGSDPTWYKMLLAGVGGPSGGVIADTIENSSPLMNWFKNIYTDGYNTHWEDVVQLFKAISTVRAADQTRMALETGNWYSRKGTILDNDIQPMDAIFQFLSGLTHQQVSDAYLKAQLEDERKEYNRVTEQEFGDRIHKALVASQAGPGYNPDQANKFFEDAGNIARMRNYPIEDFAQMLANAMKGYETLIDRIDKSFNTTHVPAGSELDQMKRYQAIQELKSQGYK